MGAEHVQQTPDLRITAIQTEFAKMDEKNNVVYVCVLYDAAGTHSGKAHNGNITPDNTSKLCQNQENVRNTASRSAQSN